MDSLQKEEEEEDYLNGADRLSARSGKEFVFFQGVDSVTKDGDILYISEEVDIDKMKEICKSLRSCIAFNTNGYLKRTIQPPSLRPHWSGDLLGGLYILGRRGPFRGGAFSSILPCTLKIAKYLIANNILTTYIGYPLKYLLHCPLL